MRCMQIGVNPLFGKCKRLSKQKRRRLPACPNFLWQHPVQKGQNGLHGCAYGVILKEGGLSAMLKAAGRVFLEALPEPASCHPGSKTLQQSLFSLGVLQLVELDIFYQPTS